MSITTRESNQDNTPIVKQQNQAESRTARGDHRFQIALQRRAVPKLAPMPTTTKIVAKKIAIPHTTTTKKQHPTHESPYVQPKKHEQDSSGAPSSLHVIQTVTEKEHPTDAHAIAHTAIGSGRADDINLLIKKITLNFQATKNEARFFVATGVFAGAQFSLTSKNQDMHLCISDASSVAKRLLTDNREQLKNSLAAREINLCEMTFLS